MTDAAVVTVVVHGVLAALLAVGGGCCLYWGYRLLFNHKAMESKSTFETTIGQHKIAFTAEAAGTAVVFVSIVWVVGSIVALPSFSQTEKGTTVAAAIPFQGSTTDLAAAQRKLIDAIGPTLTVSSAPLVIEGYADTGNEATNGALAQQRAEGVKNYLIHTYKVPEDRISVMAYGESGSQTSAGTNSVVIRSRKNDG